MTAPTTRFDALLLPGMDRAVGHARRWLRDVLGREHPCLDDAALCMSELLTNALRYTESGRAGQIRVEVTYSARTVRIEVIDDGRAATTPHVAEAGELDVTGRGLRIVASIARDWGTELRGKGRAVWFEL
ncbi:ATP-binding protein [Actinomadura verrucosospora]|uniref:Anti-sigma regulatory factor, serine/threonine protein kinase n=1 Tax=Actinomadura verrucosospora TaxID=46165 RepID=A0A7D3ZQU4_ACTVE|nr:ATP-binding protein [Actinomadura verrucosospora]QKG26881.1 anti-sigma regulatory factor, serine/threonine protein kinase [Actinomadura verrucosospora]